MHTPTLQASRKTKKTPVGEIPVNWGCVRFGEILQDKPEYGANASSVEFIEGKTPRYIRITDIDNDGGLIQSARVGLPVEFAKGYELADGDLLIARSGATVGKCFVYQKRYGSAVYAGYLIKFRIDEARCHLPFVVQWLRSPYFKKWIEQTNRAGAQPNINAEEYQSLLLPVPPLPEQSAIASILGTWDQELEQHKKLLEAKQELKQGLMQKMLTGQTRFKEFKGERWRSMLLGDVVTHEPRVTTKPKGAFLAAGIRSHGKGVFLKPDFEAEDIALDELFQLRTDDLVVNITFGWEGAVAIVPPEADGALVSHRFPTFTFRLGVSFPDYFRHVVRQKRFVYEMGLASPGGAGRNRVLSKTDFLRIPIELPSLEEQRRIADVLNICDREIELLQKQLEALKEQKRGLMQKLLTGKIRVK